MSSESEEEKVGKEEIPIPLYFDRYVTSELRSLGQRITDLKESMEERFTQVDRRFVEFKEYVDERFAQVDRRFVEFREYVDKRFDGVDKQFDGVDKQFDGVDKRLDGVDKRLDRMDGRFDKLDATLKWVIGLVIGLFSPIIIGIVAIIIKMFIFGK
ncbi:MAG: hypothetical protein ACE5PV_04690 [Candidatus Poribacteria bacterium]